MHFLDANQKVFVHQYIAEAFVLQACFEKPSPSIFGR